MAKQPNPKPTLSGLLRENQRKAQRAEVRPDVTLAAPVPATTPGPVVGSIEVFDAAGNSLGFAALYSSIL